MSLWGATITLWPQGSGPASVGPVACTWDTDGLAVVGILGALLHLVSAGWRLCCAFEVRGGTHTPYPVTGWEGAGTTEPPLGGNGLRAAGPGPTCQMCACQQEPQQLKMALICIRVCPENSAELCCGGGRPALAAGNKERDLVLGEPGASVTHPDRKSVV